MYDLRKDEPVPLLPSTVEEPQPPRRGKPAAVSPLTGQQLELFLKLHTDGTPGNRICQILNMASSALRFLRLHHKVDLKAYKVAHKLYQYNQRASLREAKGLPPIQTPSPERLNEIAKDALTPVVIPGNINSRPGDTITKNAYESHRSLITHENTTRITQALIDCALDKQPWAIVHYLDRAIGKASSSLFQAMLQDDLSRSEDFSRISDATMKQLIYEMNNPNGTNNNSAAAITGPKTDIITVECVTKQIETPVASTGLESAESEEFLGTGDN